MDGTGDYGDAISRDATSDPLVATPQASVSKATPYKVVTKHPQCPSDHPVAVVKGDGTPVACHPDTASAQAHMKALYAKAVDANIRNAAK